MFWGGRRYGKIVHTKERIAWGDPLHKNCEDLVVFSFRECFFSKLDEFQSGRRGFFFYVSVSAGVHDTIPPTKAKLTDATSPNFFQRLAKTSEKPPYSRIISFCGFFVPLVRAHLLFSNKSKHGSFHPPTHARVDRSDQCSAAPFRSWVRRRSSRRRPSSSQRQARRGRSWRQDRYARRHAQGHEDLRRGSVYDFRETRR